MITFEKLLERAESEKIAIHTATEDQAIALLTELDKRGYRWRGGHYISTYATSYENESTCYNIGMGNLTYESLDWYQAHYFIIIEFKDILLK